MTDTVLSPDDLKFLESLHRNFGLFYVRLDQNGLDTGGKLDIQQNLSLDGKTQLSQITQRLRHRLGADFQINFSQQFSFDVVRI